MRAAVDRTPTARPPTLTHTYWCRYFHRFYAAAGVCSPTRASIMTGRTHQRDCINFALSCCQEDPASTCAAGNTGTVPLTEFTFADAAKASPLGDYGAEPQVAVLPPLTLPSPKRATARNSLSHAPSYAHVRSLPNALLLPLQPQFTLGSGIWEICGTRSCRE